MSISRLLTLVSCGAGATVFACATPAAEGPAHSTTVQEEASSADSSGETSSSEQELAEPAPARTAEQEQEARIARAVVEGIASFFALLDSSERSAQLVDSHIGKFLRNAYEHVAQRQVELLRKVDLEMQFTTVEHLGQPLTLLQCRELCRQNNETACRLFAHILEQYGSAADEIEAALAWVTQPEHSARMVATYLFGEVLGHQVTRLGVVEGKLYAVVHIRSTRGEDVESRDWAFQLEFEHEHWHIVAVAPTEDGSGTDSGAAGRTTSL